MAKRRDNVPNSSAPKGVPMPRGLKWFECHWEEDSDGVLHPFVRRWNYDERDCELEEERKRVEAWAANPATPRGVRRG